MIIPVGRRQSVDIVWSHTAMEFQIKSEREERKRKEEEKEARSRGKEFIKREKAKQKINEEIEKYGFTTSDILFYKNAPKKALSSKEKKLKEIILKMKKYSIDYTELLIYIEEVYLKPEPLYKNDSPEVNELGISSTNSINIEEQKIKILNRF